MFSKSAQLYDTIYQDRIKNYADEARKIHELVQSHLGSSGRRLLDVACGTGLHLYHLREFFDVEGLDLDQGMLVVASQRLPDTPLHHGNMLNFDLCRQFDIVTCLFSSIGYVKTLENLRQAVLVMTKHLKPGGMLVMEPWFTPEQWHPGRVSATFVDEPERKIVRMNVSCQKDRLSSFEFHYLVGTSQGVEHFTELHELGLFTHEEYLDAFRCAGLSVIHDPQGLDGRGLYIGINIAEKTE